MWTITQPDWPWPCSAALDRRASGGHRGNSPFYRELVEGGEFVGAAGRSVIPERERKRGLSRGSSRCHNCRNRQRIVTLIRLPCTMCRKGAKERNMARLLPPLRPLRNRAR